MQANTNTPSEIFGSNVQYVVPIFQRPYVWTRSDQWEPLWEDIRALSESVHSAPVATYGAPSVVPHFLGAVVIDQQLSPSGYIAIRHIVDGQQRLTTLQVLIDAALEITDTAGDPEDANGLRVLALNNANLSRKDPDRVFKVWPTRRDQDAFRAAMTDGVVVPEALASSAIVQAHKFFRESITAWAHADATEGDDTVQRRLHALVLAIREHLKIVVIDLEPGDNAQVIFETLNHRGSPLLAADLVKNMVFQIALIQGADVDKLYEHNWTQFDAQPWRKPVAQGRLYRPRVDIFLNHWLVMKLQREVPSDRVFAEFRDGVLLQKDVNVESVLAQLSSDSEVFDALENFPSTSVEGKFHYRIIRAMDTATVTPVLLWLLRWSEKELSVVQRHRALSALESWLIRRALARLTSKNINLLMLELLRYLSDKGPIKAGEHTENFLAGQSADSRFWPDDETVRSTLRSQSTYTSLLRARLRMVLEALEDDLRSQLGEGQSCARNLTVEHVMPRAWREHWPLEIVSTEGALARDHLVHQLGNLTLVSEKLNPSMSNRPWTAAGAVSTGLPASGKRQYLLKHSNLSLNADIVSRHSDAWSEQDIRDRTESMISRILAIWPRPAVALVPDKPPTLDPTAVNNIETDLDEIDPNSGAQKARYSELLIWLLAQDADEVTLSFTQVEQILDMQLPPVARNTPTYWKDRTKSPLSWTISDAEWIVQNVDLLQETVILVRQLTAP